jgi:transcriptional regulator with XRE-family HTH domain
MNWLELLRLVRGLRSTELADATGIHPCTYSQLENGWRTRIGSTDMKRLQKYYGEGWTSEVLLGQVNQEDIKWPV